MVVLSSLQLHMCLPSIKLSESVQLEDAVLAPLYDLTKQKQIGGYYFQ